MGYQKASKSNPGFKMSVGDFEKLWDNPGNLESHMYVQGSVQTQGQHSSLGDT